jgi:leader peptidase (prepilin peptidase) / N-methyltransferase
MTPMNSVPPLFWVVSVGALGAIFGSYVNMAAYRLPRDISTVTRTRSFCPSCQHQLAWYENIPILSYLFLRGHCKHCGKTIGVRYLVTELIVTALFMLSAYQYFVLNGGLQGVVEMTKSGQPITRYEPLVIFVVQLFFIVDMVLLSVIDLETWLIPFQTTLPGMIAGFILAVACPQLHLSATEWVLTPNGAPIWQNALIDSFEGLVLGAGILWAVGFLTTFLTFFWFRWRGDDRRPIEGMGLGDVHLLGMVGAMLGWKPAIATIFLGVFIGSATGIGKISWDKFQRWRLGDTHQPWQPVYDLGEEGPPEAPNFWPLGLMGVLVLLSCGYLWQQSEMTAASGVFDARLIPVIVMLLLGLMLIIAFPFMVYLKKIDLLPQGEITQDEEEETVQETLSGNYVPFGPSLAAAALLVVFFDPLLRELAYCLTASTTAWPYYPFHLLSEHWLSGGVKWLIHYWRR